MHICIYLLCHLLMFVCTTHRCFAGSPSRGTRNEMNQAFARGAVSSFNLDSDDEEQHDSPRAHIRGPFSDDEDEGRGASSSGTSSGASRHSFGRRRPHQLALSDSESEEDSKFRREESSGTSGV